MRQHCRPQQHTKVCVCALTTHNISSRAHASPHVHLLTCACRRPWERNGGAASSNARPA
jgi:hypothetical protein